MTTAHLLLTLDIRTSPPTFATMLDEYVRELRRFGQAKYANTAKGNRRRVRARR